MINGIKIFLGEEALQYIIIVFSHCTKKQTEDPKYFKQLCWNPPVKAFVNSVGNRWAISPNPELFPTDSLVHQQRLKELREKIDTIDGIYTSDLLKKSWESKKKMQELQEKLKGNDKENMMRSKERR